MSGMSQEELAEYLHIDERTVRRYESGELPVPDHIMVEVAELPGVTEPAFLMHRHYKEKYGIADEILPPVQRVPLAVAVINLLREGKRLEQSQVMTKLLELADDGIIDPEEKTDFELIMDKLDGFRKAMELLRYSRKEG